MEPAGAGSLRDPAPSPRGDALGNLSSTYLLARTNLSDAEKLQVALCRRQCWSGRHRRQQWHWSPPMQGSCFLRRSGKGRFREAVGRRFLCSLPAVQARLALILAESSTHVLWLRCFKALLRRIDERALPCGAPCTPYDSRITLSSRPCYAAKKLLRLCIAIAARAPECIACAMRGMASLTS